ELQAAETLRRKALEALLTGDADAREAARKELDQCRQRYAAIEHAGKALGAAFMQLDESRVFLASWMSFEAPDPKLQQELDPLWQRIVNDCRELQVQLVAP